MTKLKWLRRTVRPSSIRTQVAATLVVAVAAVSIFSLAIELRLRNARQDDAELALRQAAILAADGQQERLRTAEYVLATTAAYDPVVAAALNPDSPAVQQACGRRLGDSLGQINGLLALSLFDMQGSLVCSSGQAQRHAASIAHRLYFTTAVSTGGFGVGEVVAAQANGEPSLGFAFPVRSEDGRVLGVMATGILLNDPSAFLGGVQTPGKSAVSIVDGGGNRVSTTDPALRSRPLVMPEQRPGPGAAVFYEANGRRLAMSRVTPLNSPELYAVVSMSNGDFPAIVDAEFIAEVGIILVAVSAAAVAALWLVDSRVVQRLRLVGDTASRLENRDFAARSGLGEGKDELAALARELDSMAEALQRLERERALALEQRDEFLGFVSHELKNLSFGIWSDARLLARHGDQLSHGDSQDIAQSLGANSEKLQQIISDIFMLARAELGDMANEPLSPGPLVRQTVARFQASTPRRHVDVEIDPELPPCEGQPTFFEQVLLNLLTNAHKYSPASSPLTVTVRRVDGMVEFSVQDGGSGVPDDALERIFERYYRTAPAGIPGTGLGLAVCRRLVHAQGGRIWAENLHPAGFAVRFTLPAVEGFSEDAPVEQEAVPV